MESQNRFNLTDALTAWRSELVDQPGLGEEDRRELESHLQESLTDLQQRGLSSEEAFWVARKRLGRSSEIGAEFRKENPAAVWRDRVFWMASGILASYVWFRFLVYALNGLFNQINYWGLTIPSWVNLGTYVGLTILLTLLAYTVALGRWSGVVNLLNRQFSSPRRLAWILCVLMAGSAGVSVVETYSFLYERYNEWVSGVMVMSPPTPSWEEAIYNAVLNLAWPILLAVLVVRLATNRTAFSSN